MCSSCTRLVKGLAVEFEQLRQIDAIARTGTFSAAAEALHTSQPSVSRSMRALERELGCELFNRSRNHVELNEAGELALKHARAILAEERRMRDAFDDLTRTNRTLNVASVAPAPVWRLASRVTERFPGTMLTSETIDDEQEVERRLFDRSADLAITRRPIGLPNVVCVPFMVENLFIYAPATDPIAQQTSVKLADLDGRTFLMNADVGFWGDMTRAALPNARIIMQQDSNVLAQLIRTSDVLGFVTDVSEFNHPDENRPRARAHPRRRRARHVLRGRHDRRAAGRAGYRRGGQAVAAQPRPPGEHPGSNDPRGQAGPILYERKRWNMLRPRHTIKRTGLIKHTGLVLSFSIGLFPRQRTRKGGQPEGHPPILQYRLALDTERACHHAFRLHAYACAAICPFTRFSRPPISCTSRWS